ncbi:MAG TPA: RNA polymerase sigma factor [Gemmataceae bacterium]|nr:RNA polymerase sigma factor [Gemmataceae bacterium]
MSSDALAAGIRRLRGTMAAQCRNDESDEQLLAAFTSRRDEDAFAVLVRRHGPMVLNVCRRVLGHEQDAEDAFQATFLLLAQGATGLRKQTALAGFLHGAAYRIALAAKRSAARRRKHEGALGELTQPRSPVDPADEFSWREVRTLLDEEIARLPEKYRTVFVLCCLEGLSQVEAARRLGMKERTLSSWLLEARKRLASRLVRRGVELTAVLAAATLATQPASALPAGLMATTIKAALATAAGESLASVVSVSVAELVKGMTAAMIATKVKMATVVLMGVSLLTGAGMWAYRGLAANVFTPVTPFAEPPAAKADDKPKTVSPQREAAKTVEIQGRVLGPDGKPKAGAAILLLGPLDPGEQQELPLEIGKVRRLGVSAADGRFTVAVEKPKRAMQHYLIAQCEGAGIDFFDTDDLKFGKSIESRLVKDHAIRGRIVNTEGRPVAGVRVAVNHLGIYPNNSLDSFLVFWKNRPFNWGLRGGVKHIYSGAGAVLAATTDADGRFVLHGVGAERLVSLRLSGGGIAADEVWIVNRAGFDPKPYNQATLDNTPKGERGFHGRWMLSGPDVSVAVAAEKVIRGVVAEADTGKVRPGVLVQLTRKNGDDHNGGDYLSLKLQAKTDAQGRYEIHGAHKAKSYLVEVGSDAATGYLGRAVWAEDTLGYRPITADIRVRKGVIVTGKMIDKATGKPIDGYVLAADLNDNPFVKEYSDDSGLTVIQWATAFWGTNADGVFRAVTIPGPVLLMGGPRGRNKWEYKTRIPDPDYPQYFEKEGNFYRYRGSGFTIVQGIFCKVLQIKPGVPVVEQDIVLERQRRNVLGMVKIQDAEGRPLDEVEALRGWNRIDGDSCTIYGEATDPPYLLIFYQPKRELAGTLTVKAGVKLPPIVKLKAMGSVQGRLLDADGKPLEGIVVAPRYRDHAANVMNSRVHEARPIASNADGNFLLDSLIPELPFELTFRRGRRDFARESKSAEAAIQVNPSAYRDVGAIELKRISDRPAE